MRVAVAIIGVAEANGVSVRGNAVNVTDGAGVLLANTNAGSVGVAPRIVVGSCAGASGDNRMITVTTNMPSKKTRMTPNPR